MNALKTSYFKTIALTGFIFAFSLFGFTAAFGYGGGGGGGGGRPPSNITAINYPLTVASGQAGEAISNFGQQATVTLSVPTGAVSQKTTFKIQMSAANANERPDTEGGVYMIGDKVFSITATSISNNPVTEFIKTLTISIALPEMIGNTGGLDVYYFDSVENEWVLISGASFDSATGKATFTVNHLTAFSVIYGNSEESIAVAKEPKKKATAENNSNKKNDDVVVLGVEHYADGALIRGKNKKIYVVADGKLKHIGSLKQLVKYAGQEIFDVDDETLNQYSGVEALVVEGYGNGALIRGKNMKIYVITDGKLKHIGSLKQLVKYAGQEIFDVDDDVVNSFESIE